MPVGALAAADGGEWLDLLLRWLLLLWLILKVVIGFSLVVVVHELGHFLMAKWAGIRVLRFAVGFFGRVCGWRRGEGFTFGRRPNYTPEELARRGWGETDYCLNLLPLGGYVKLLGEDDIIINEQTGEMRTSSDPRAFPNKPVGKRMLVIAGGVLFNLLFAVLVFTGIFLFSGRQAVAPVVGLVEAESPAAQAGLQPGDRIVAVNGRRVRDFQSVAQAVILGGSELTLTIERDGAPLPTRTAVKRQVRGDEKEPLGFFPATIARLTSEPGFSLPPGLRPDDLVVAVNGRPLIDAAELDFAALESQGRPLELTVERRAAAGGTERVQVSCTPTMILASPEAPEGGGRPDHPRHLLGLVPRQIVRQVLPRSPAARARVIEGGSGVGFQPGDVIVLWDTIPNPSYPEITRAIHARDGQPLRVVVERDGQPVTLEVTPRREFRLFGSAPPRVGLAFGDEDVRPVVASIVPDSPAAALGLPRGSELRAINEQPVATWTEAFAVLRAAAGQRVAVRYRSGPDEATAHLDVPSNILHELNLPPAVHIRRVAGEDSVTLPSGRRQRVSSSPNALAEALRRHVGRTITIEYGRNALDSETRRAEFTVRPDNIDPWPLRVAFGIPGLVRSLSETTISAEGNPVRAVGMGLEACYRNVEAALMILGSMLKREVGTQHVAGPVGIFEMAYRESKSGVVDLLHFLAFISVNLAVLNFLPLPVLDGGTMVFLILEKLRGRPVPLRVQVTTTLIGLALIVCVFLFVTLQDISRWGPGG